MVITLFAGCKKSPNKDSSSSLLTSEVSTPNYVYDEEKKAVVDTTTGEIVSDATYNEKTKEIVKGGKVIQKNTEKVSSAEATQIVEKRNEEIKNSLKNDNKGNSNSGSGSTNNPTDTNGNSHNNQFANAPTSNKTVSFNKQKLQDKMYSSYEDQKPHFTPTAVMSKDEFKMQVKGECPVEGKEIFDWFMNCVKNNVSDSKSFEFNKRNMDIISNISLFIIDNTNLSLCIYKPELIGSNVVLKIDNNLVNSVIDEQYKKYADPIIRNNQNNQDLYNNQLRYFNEMVAYIPETVNLVCNAVSVAGVKQGENEVSAINKIVNYISQKCNYWDWAKAQGENMGQWIRECLKDGHAVCDGYAKSFYAMCYYCGIDINYILGTGNGEAHSWNSIKINGKNYLFDVTWYDIQQGSAIKDKKYVWCEENDKNFNSEHKGSITTPRFW